MIKYYYAGSTRIAMRTGAGTNETGLLWLFGDHLGSTSRAANEDGTPYANGEQGYKPWGEKRYPTGASGLPTTYRFTGERQETGVGPSGGEGLYWVGSRWLDPYLNRWIQPDSLIPGMDNPQRWDRFGYVLNNPLRYTDPSGHSPAGPCSPGDNCDTDQGNGQGNNSDTDQGGGNGDSPGSTSGTDAGGCGGQGCDLGGNNDDDNSSDDGSIEERMPDGNPTAPHDAATNLNCSDNNGMGGCLRKVIIIIEILEVSTVFTLVGVILQGGSITVLGLTFGFSAAPSTVAVVAGGVLELVALAGYSYAVLDLLPKAVDCYDQNR